MAMRHGFTEDEVSAICPDEDLVVNLFCLIELAYACRVRSSADNRQLAGAQVAISMGGPSLGSTC